MATHVRYKIREDEYSHYDGAVTSITSPIDHARPRPYERNIYHVTGSWPGYSRSPASMLAYLNRGLNGPAYAKAYDRLMANAKGGSAANLGVTLAQWKSSLVLITESCTRIARSWRALKHGNVYSAARHLTGHALSKRHANKIMRQSQLASDRWLELQFGWLPLIQDVNDAVDVMQQSIPTERIRGRASQALERRVDVNTGAPTHIWTQNAFGKKDVELSAVIVGVNPNLLLANQLGLTNPSVVAWDVVPFSFVVDWFLPVGKFLSSFDAEVGFQLTDRYGTYKLSTSGDETYTMYGSITSFGLSSAVEVKRQLLNDFSLPTFSDRLKPLSSSLWQATTSVALVLQLFGSYNRVNPPGVDYAEYG